MAPYSYIHSKNSVIAKNNIKFHIPGGLSTKKFDWYPFVMTFNDDEGLSRYLGEKVEFSILYNFGYFDLSKGTSVYYDPSSPYYSSFYGGYIVKSENDSKKFGFSKDGSIDVKELAKVPEYDQKYLVLPTIGCPYDKRVFDGDILSVGYNIEYIGFQDWIRVDSNVMTNSPIHKYDGFKQGYLQYGIPLGIFDYSEEYPLISLSGRAYIRYFKEENATIVLYIMAPSWDVVNECDEGILSNTNLGF